MQVRQTELRITLRTLRALRIAPLFLAIAACNALDAPGPKDRVVIIPTDVRAAQLTAAPPAPISGGTLAVSADGKLAVAADPDRDRVSVVDLESKAVQHIALEPGDEPGRVVLDDGGHAYVALRRGGALALIDLTRGELEQRLPVCAAPRGMVFDAEQQLVHVACMDGRLLSVGRGDALQPAAAAKVVRDVQVGLDLRDVMLRPGVNGNELWVSSFKRVELTHLGADGQVLERVAPGEFAMSDFTTTLSRTPGMRMMQPHIAYRSMSDALGNLLVLHQAESTEEVAIDQPADSEQSSPYGSSGGCSGIVTPAISSVDLQGKVKTLPINSGVLSVDMAASPASSAILVVQSGATDLSAPQRETFFDFQSSSSIASMPASAPFLSASTATADGISTRITRLDWRNPGQDCGFGAALAIGGQSTAVAYLPHPQPAPTVSGQDPGDWVVQSREPARLTIISYRGSSAPSATAIDLGGESVRDTGHDLFHLDAGGGVACASCHAEGAEDGHVWSFTRLGLRRTQALHVGLEGTAPFHWAGDESDLSHLMSDVFVGRMGGVHQSESRVAALTRWLFALQPPAAPVLADADTKAIERGQVLFQSAEVGCASCHSGDKLTDNRTVDVGTGEALQVPSLRGIAYRAPFMHNGCALSLRDRFTAACGGSKHGNIAELDASQIDDLVAYLKTL